VFSQIGESVSLDRIYKVNIIFVRVYIYLINIIISGGLYEEGIKQCSKANLQLL